MLRNVQGRTLQVRGMFSGWRLHVKGIGDRHYKWEDSKGDRQTDITSGRNVQGHTLQVRGKHSGEWTDITCERLLQKMDVTSQRKLQWSDARWRWHRWTLHHTVCWAAHKTLRSACLNVWGKLTNHHKLKPHLPHWAFQSPRTDEPDIKGWMKNSWKTILRQKQQEEQILARILNQNQKH